MDAVQPQAPWSPGRGYYAQPRRDSNGLCTAAMWLGIGALTALVVGWLLLIPAGSSSSEPLAGLPFALWVLATLASIAAVVLGIVGLARAGRGLATNRGRAIAGLVCGVVGFVFGVMPLATLFLALTVMGP